MDKVQLRAYPKNQFPLKTGYFVNHLSQSRKNRRAKEPCFQGEIVIRNFSHEKFA
jgi:hypothetical protein